MAEGLEQLFSGREANIYCTSWSYQSLLHDARKESSPQTEKGSGTGMYSVEEDKDYPDQCECTAAKKSLRAIDRCSQLADLYSVMDTMSPSDSSHSQWWKTKARSSLLDELPHISEEDPVRSDIRQQVISVMDIEIIASSSTEPMLPQDSGECCYEFYSSSTLVLSDVHCSQMNCCEVFHVQNELSRVAMVTECLPALHIICKSEQEREHVGTKRRCVFTSTIGAIVRCNFFMDITCHKTLTKICCRISSIVRTNL